jgi:hypothetical protein
MQMVRSADGFVVSHEETLGTVSNGATATFLLVGKTNGYAINAGSSYTFPWLSGIARHFEKYQLHELQFTLVSSNPLTHAGQVFFCLDGDTTDVPPTSPAEMLAMKWSRVASVINGLKFSFDRKQCSLLHEPMKRAYVKEVTGADAFPRSSTVGRAYVAIDAPQASTFTLKVRYSIELSEPQLVPSGSVAPQQIYADTAFTQNVWNRFTSIPTPSPILGMAPSTLVTGIAAIDLNKVGEVVQSEVSLKDLTSTDVMETVVDGRNIFYSILDSFGQTLYNIDPTVSNAVFTRAHLSKMGTVASDDYVSGGGITLLIDAIRSAYPLARWIAPAFALYASGTYTPSWTVSTEL